MQKKKAHHMGASQRDPLRRQLDMGKAPPISQIMDLAPPWQVPLCPPFSAPRKNGDYYWDTSGDWGEKFRRLMDRFPGLMPDINTRDEMKKAMYPAHAPAPNAPLAVHVKAVIDHARSWWSRQVIQRATTLQFEEWLRKFVAYEIEYYSPLWENRPGTKESYELIRLSFGLPRYLPPRSGEASGASA